MSSKSKKRSFLINKFFSLRLSKIFTESLQNEYIENEILVLYRLRVESDREKTHADAADYEDVPIDQDYLGKGGEKNFFLL